MNTDSRLRKLRRSLAENKIDAILVSQPENRYYLSGFDGSAGYLLITQHKAVLATDFRYIEQVKRQSPDYEILKVTGDIRTWFPGLASDMNLKRVGFEAGHITCTIFQQLSDTLEKGHSRLKLVPLDGLVESLRAVKEPEEIELITRAVEIADSAFECVEGMIHSGMSEKEVAWEIEKSLREKGSEAIPFDIIVASGTNAALPHARPSVHAIQPGEPVVIDMGARVGGYTSDLSRTICPGKRDDTFKKIYRAVLDAQLAALNGTAEGMTGGEADSLARKSIEQAGYGEAFGHGLGHGIGLAPHEMPRLGPGSTERLVDGMVFTVEPGIYLPEWGGVRIEDTAVMENGRIRLLSQARKLRE